MSWSGLVTLNDMKAKQEALVKEREKQLAKKEQSKELQLWVITAPLARCHTVALVGDKEHMALQWSVTQLLVTAVINTFHERKTSSGAHFSPLITALSNSTYIRQNSGTKTTTTQVLQRMWTGLLLCVLLLSGLFSWLKLGPFKGSPDATAACSILDQWFQTLMLATPKIFLRHHHS